MDLRSAPFALPAVALTSGAILTRHLTHLSLPLAVALAGLGLALAVRGASPEDFHRELLLRRAEVLVAFLGSASSRARCGRSSPATSTPVPSGPGAAVRRRLSADHGMVRLRFFEEEPVRLEVSGFAGEPRGRPSKR